MTETHFLLLLSCCLVACEQTDPMPMGGAATAKGGPTESWGDLSDDMQACEAALYAYFIADVDGDWDGDLVRASRSTGAWAWVESDRASFVSTATADGEDRFKKLLAGFESADQVGDHAYGIYDQAPPNPVMGDVDGDGDADGGMVIGGGWWIALSDRSRFVGVDDHRYRRADKYTNVYRNWLTGAGEGRTQHFLFDMNGDRAADAITYDPDNLRVTVYPSSGADFSGTSFSFTLGSAAARLLVGDVDNDQRGDLILYTAGTWEVVRSTGTGFVDLGVWATNTGTDSDTQLIADVDNDGFMDAVSFYRSTGVWEVARSTGTSFDSAVQWATGLGTGSSVQLLGNVDGDGNFDPETAPYRIYADAVVIQAGEDAEVAISTGNSYQNAGTWLSYGGSRYYVPDYLASAATCSTSTYQAEGGVCVAGTESYVASQVNIGFYIMQVRHDVSTMLMQFEESTGDQSGRYWLLTSGKTLGLHSDRNESCEDSPPLRAPQYGYAYGYMLQGGRAGWIPVCAVREATNGKILHGPAGVDFTVTQNAYDSCSSTVSDGGCEDRGINLSSEGADQCDGGTTCSGCTAKVLAQDIHLRWSPLGTSKAWMHRDDEVDVVFVSGQWALVKVRSPDRLLTPQHTQGWTQMTTTNFAPTAACCGCSVLEQSGLCSTNGGSNGKTNPDVELSGEEQPRPR